MKRGGVRRRRGEELEERGGVRGEERRGRENAYLMIMNCHWILHDLYPLS